MTLEHDHEPRFGISHGSFLSYVTGFLYSIALTFIAFFIVWEHLFSTQTAIMVLLGLALAQLVAQVVFFLHLGTDHRSRWNMVVFSFSILMVAIIVIGSLWIMRNLNQNMMTPQETDLYMLTQ